jgi:hypothetical protein
MTEADRPYGEVAVAFADISRTLFTDPTVGGTLQRIVDFAQATVEGCDAAGISLLTGTEVATPVWSDPERQTEGGSPVRRGNGRGRAAMTLAPLREGGGPPLVVPARTPGGSVGS